MEYCEILILNSADSSNFVNVTNFYVRPFFGIHFSIFRGLKFLSRSVATFYLPEGNIGSTARVSQLFNSTSYCEMITWCTMVSWLEDTFLDFHRFCTIGWMQSYMTDLETVLSFRTNWISLRLWWKCRFEVPINHIILRFTRPTFLLSSIWKKMLNVMFLTFEKKTFPRKF